MSLSTQISTAGLPDLAAVLALSTESGWNQTEEDWRRILTLWPESSFCIRDNGRVVATAVVATYEKRLAWIGMVLTKQEFRGQGFARALLQQCLDYADAKGVATVKLDATDMGRPVYQKLGFLDERPVSRWLRRGSSLGIRPSAFDSWLDADLLTLDRRAFGANRKRLLESLAEGSDVFALSGRAFAILRPGRTAYHFGPCLAQTHDVARDVLIGALGRHGSHNVIWDLADESEPAVRLAMEFGFVRSRKLIRMYRGGPAPEPWKPQIYGLAGFEFG